MIESAGTDLSNPDIVISPGKVGFGKTPAAAMDVNGTLKSENLYLNKKRLYPVPYGTIMMWSGSGDLPSGWQFCDGTNGMPNLKNKFIKGTTLDGMNQTGGKNASSVTGGAHTHSGSGGHEHAVVDGSSGTGDHKHSASVHYQKFNETKGAKPPHTAERIKGLAHPELFINRHRIFTHSMLALNGRVIIITLWIKHLLESTIRQLKRGSMIMAVARIHTLGIINHLTMYWHLL